MFYFFFHIFISLLIIILVFHLLNKEEITILETLILLFIFNISMFTLYNNLNILYTIIASLLVITIYYLYKYLYKTSLNKKINNNKVLINRGMINFHELIKNNYSYETLLLNLKKRGISNPSLVDYCIKNGNDLIIFQKNSIKNYPISLIIDGTILKDNLFSINKTMEWLDNKLLDNNLKLNEINYAYYKNKQVYFVTN